MPFEGIYCANGTLNVLIDEHIIFNFFFFFLGGGGIFEDVNYWALHFVKYKDDSSNCAHAKTSNTQADGYIYRLRLTSPFG